MPVQSAVAHAEMSLPNGVRLGCDSLVGDFRGPTLSFGIPEVERALPDGGLPQGQVVELLGVGTCLSTSVCLGAIREAQQRAGLQGGEAWGAFIDPRRTLYAPAVARAGVELERLLVLHPELKDVSRVAIQLAEARAFAVIVVDLQGTEREYSTREWSRAVRRIALAIEKTKSTVLLLTSASLTSANARHTSLTSIGLTRSGRAKRALAGLPVGLRVQLSRPTPGSVSVSIGKDKQGRVGEARSVGIARLSRVAALHRVAGFPSEKVRSSSSDRPAPLPSGGDNVVPSKRDTSDIASTPVGLLSTRASELSGDELSAKGLRASEFSGDVGWKHPRNVRPRLRATSAGQLSLLEDAR